MKTFIELETPRLHLRQWHDADYAPFAALNADPEVMCYFAMSLNREQSDALANRCRRLIETHGWGFWALEEKHSRRFIGMCGVNRPTANLPFNPCIEIGWRLTRSAWGKGYATEAARAALDFAFQGLGYQEIVAFTAVNNRRSRAVMERLGMHDSKENFEHPLVPVGHPLREHVLYKISVSSRP